MRNFVTTIFLLPLLGLAACAQDVPVSPQPERPKQERPQPAATPAAKLPADRNKFGVIICGISGEETYAKQFGEWTKKLSGALVGTLGFAEDQVLVLNEKPEGQEQRATAENVRQVFAALRGRTKPDQQVFIFFIGHGSFDGKIAKFNLMGPDLSANDYAQLIGNLPARNVVVVNMASASGEFIKPLSGRDRILVTATRSGAEQNATHFAQHFIAALGNPEADSDKNGRVSVLEAFNYASKLTGESYEHEGKLATEHSLIDDNGDGTGHQKAEAGDGGLAKVTYFDSLPQQQAGGDPELAKLFADRMRLEGEVEQLKARKDEMAAEEYETALEKLLIELAKLSQSIKTKHK
ncbi:MAG TPA: C13 family peptidase [Blastocatellia bacterium]|nr:C13 family peptidase [Blastocatellia bacterium]